MLLPTLIYRVRQAEMTDEDLYYCVAENEFGKSENSDYVNITVSRRNGRTS